jgi:hypothetical protein
VRNRFDSKIVYFVICERSTFKVVAVLELDDRGYVASADYQRDAVAKAAGYQTFPVQARQRPTEAAIAALFQQARSFPTPS